LNAASQWSVGLLLVAGLSAVLPSMASAQLVVRGYRSLRFGDVVAGTSTSVVWNEYGRAGAYSIRGTRDAEVLLTFSLPTVLRGPAGALLPIQFANNDAGFEARRGQAVAFDPNAPFVTDLGQAGRARVFLGGTVVPAYTQRAGFYRENVTLTVAYTAN
jgi:hypothetical protein